MKTFDPRNWYWIVGGDATKAYSSIAGDYVPADDASFLAWKADGTVPTNIASNAELGDVLAPYALRPANSSVLNGYTESQAVKLTIAVVAKVLFNHENRVRVLEGKQPINANQFKNAIKALL